MPQYHDDTITLNESHCKTPEQNHNHPAWHFQHLVGDQSGDFKSESQDELMWWTSFSSYRYNTIHGIRKAGGITITWVCDRDRAPVIMMPNTVGCHPERFIYPFTWSGCSSRVKDWDETVKHFTTFCMLDQNGCIAYPLVLLMKKCFNFNNLGELKLRTQILNNSTVVHFTGDTRLNRIHKETSCDISFQLSLFIIISWN